MKVKKHPWSGKTGPAAEFMRGIDALARTRSHRDVLQDFSELAFCAFAGALYSGVPERSGKLEEQYQAVASKREPAFVQELSRLAAVAVEGVTDGGDFFGPIVAELGCLSRGLGQFFTPDALSEFVAGQTLNAAFLRDMITEVGFITLLEPACGTAGMALAAAKVMRQHGFDPARHLWVTAIDIDAFCVRLAYLQLSWAGIPAHVAHGNFLSDERWETTATPAWVAFKLEHGPRLAARPTEVAAPAPAPLTAPQLQTRPRPAQSDLFEAAHG